MVYAAEEGAASLLMDRVRVEGMKLMERATEEGEGDLMKLDMAASS